MRRAQPGDEVIVETDGSGTYRGILKAKALMIQLPTMPEGQWVSAIDPTSVRVVHTEDEEPA